MKDGYEITGLFYEVAGHKCRKYLDIKLRTSTKTEPDLMVVMMNPGSSYPLDGVDNNSTPVEAEPDDTQDQIMKIMNNASYEYARVLNLSDKRTPDSNALYAFIKSEESCSIPHSIFCDARDCEMNSLYIRDVPVIYGWGVDPALTKLAKLAIQKINHPSPVGLKKEGHEYAYYHPLPRIYKKKIEWVEKISALLNRT